MSERPPCECAGKVVCAACRRHGASGRLTAPEWGVVGAAYQRGGETLAALARRHGMTEKTLRAHLRAMGLWRQGPAPRPARPLALALAAYQRGLALRLVSQEYGVSYSTVRKALVRQGLLRPKGRRVPPPVPDAVAAYQRGATLRQVRLQYGVPPSTLRRYLVRHGLLVRRAGRNRYTTNSGQWLVASG